ncbi:MAG TPA: site-2 protease family protein [Anaeromyxobacteraceae bacterium]|nr:site-2 protease family protein [Anaeromyxobacteraceae bacterium]
MDAVTARPRLATRIPYLNIALFLATVVTTVTFGGLLHGARETSLPEIVGGGLPFAASLVSILLCHEMGHYLMARAWHVDSTLPFFIPVPFGFGTFGAVIRIRSLMPNRHAILDIGAAGPIAGFVVALPLLFWGLAHSEVRALGDAAFEHGNAGSPFQLLRALAAGAPLVFQGSVANPFGDSVIVATVSRLVLGELPPYHEVLFHPVATGAWIGLFITTLNLIPLGQLDGGHVIYALLGRRRARALSRAVSWALFACGFFFSWTWLVWWAITRYVVGFRHPEPMYLEERLDGRRRAIAIGSLVLFALTFVPVPMQM